MQLYMWTVKKHSSSVNFRSLCSVNFSKKTVHLPFALSFCINFRTFVGGSNFLIRPLIQLHKNKIKLGSAKYIIGRFHLLAKKMIF
jgi:hypothetical protein